MSEEEAVTRAIEAMASTEMADVKFLLLALDQSLLGKPEAIEIVKSFRKQVIQVVASANKWNIKEQ